MYILGYLPRDGRVYLSDKDVNVMSYALSLSVVEYQTLVLRGDMDSAAELLETIPDDQKNKVARFLEGQNYKELALTVATDPEHRFDLAMSLNDLQIALDIAREANVDHKWKTVGDAALTQWNVALSEECFTNAKDLGSLLLLHSSTANGEGLRKLALQADEAGANNIAFSCLWQLSDVDACIDLLLRTNRVAEAVMFAQTYKPSRAPAVVAQWRETLEKDKKGKVAKIIGIPPGVEGADDDLFPEWDEYLRLQSERPKSTLVDLDGKDSPEEEQTNGAHDSGSVKDAEEVDAEE
jgi:coatomer subunit beta'